MKNNNYFSMALLVIAMVAFSLSSITSSSFAQTAATDSNLQQQNATATANINPPTASIGTKIPLTYQGPPPSDVDPQLVGPHQLLRAGKVDANSSTVTLPLYQGQIAANASGAIAGKKVWYILTDTDDKGNADQLGLNYSPKLTFAGAEAARNAVLEKNSTLTFSGGAVDFRPNNTLVAGGSPPNNASNAFPPKTAMPGSMGDKDYSPLVKITNAGNHVYNAPIIAFGVDASQLSSFCNTTPNYNVVHDKVVNICPEKKTVTLKLTQGFSFGRPVIYLSLEASVPLAATLEKATYAPRLASITTGQDDGAFSGVERLFAVTNGQTGKDNPQRQGFNSAISDGLSPLNVLGGIPSIGLDYSPMWDVNLGQWTDQAISNHYTSRVIDEFQYLRFVQDGWITGLGGAPFGSAGIIVNCPIVARLL